MVGLGTMCKQRSNSLKSLKATYLWFVVFIAVFLLIAIVPVVYLQPIAVQHEIGFNANGDDWSLEDLEKTLLSIREDLLIISGQDQRDQQSDFIVTWTNTRKRSEIEPDPLAPRVYAVLREKNLQTVGGLKLSLEPAYIDQGLPRTVSPFVWLPFSLILLAFFLWQQRYKSAISASRIKGVECKPILIALALGMSLAPIIGMLIGYLSPEIADRVPSFSWETGDWQLLFTLIVLIPLAEEIVFRGWLLERLSQVLAPSISLAISAIAFSAIHPMGLVANSIFLIPGLVWGHLWLRYRSLLICTVAHGSYNLTAIVLSAHFQT